MNDSGFQFFFILENSGYCWLGPFDEPSSVSVFHNLFFCDVNWRRGSQKYKIFLIHEAVRFLTIVFSVECLLYLIFVS